MGKSNVRSYSDDQILNRVKQLNSYKHIPVGFWIGGIQSNEDEHNVLDDKFYIFESERFISVLTGTTNSGEYGLLNWKKWSKQGTAQIKPDEWYYNVWTRGLHNGKVEALRQTGGFKVIRDNNNNKKSGDVDGWCLEYNKGLNFHPNTYSLNSRVKRWIIGKWSTGCQVTNDIPKYKRFMAFTKPQNVFTYVLLKEF